MRDLAFSLFYFASADEGWERPTPARDKYRLVLDGAKEADRLGLAAVWTPERHFHAFGGLFPNPSVLGAAIATATTRVAVRAGRVVLPQHHPARVAEEWAVVDNLSGGRVGLAVASGWHARDFLLAPGAYEARREALMTGLDAVRKLWRGEAVTFPNGAGVDEAVRQLPRPVQRELPVWVTAAESVETFRLAGRLGAGVLTHLLNQDVATLETKIAAYRAERAAHGHPGEGHVTLMLHTFLGRDLDAVRRQVRGPFLSYLAQAVDLTVSTASSHGLAGPGGLTDALKEQVLARSFERYFDADALLGTPASCLPRVERLRAAGVNEIACLIDFGMPVDEALNGIGAIAELAALTQAPPAPRVDAAAAQSRAEARQEGRPQHRRLTVDRPLHCQAGHVRQELQQPAVGHHAAVHP
jgi:natural product biosynthesis luciferase-like monooxygenase protein